MLGFNLSGCGTMWTVHVVSLPDSSGLRLTVSRDAKLATFADIILGLREDASFRAAWNAALAAIHFTAFRWETPPSTTASRDHEFECVILNDPHLDRRPDSTSFTEYFTSAATGIAVFPNLRKDATLIVPCPVASASAYGHLAAFVRHAPAHQQDALWKAVGDTWNQRLSPVPVWLSTAGAGVPWLHVRFDSVPKYYGHAPYRKI